MIKIIFCVVVFSIIALAGAGAYHLYQVKQKNLAEMAQFENNIALNADLGRVLVVYYSLTGHTKDIAMQIKAKTNADVYEIQTLKSYTSPSVYLESKKELKNRDYPELKKGFKPNMANYDIIFVGSPVWWYTMTPALYAFLQNIDFKGTRVAPFSTQGSNPGTFFKDFAAHAQNATIVTSESFNNMDDSFAPQISNKINAWLNKLAAE